MSEKSEYDAFIKAHPDAVVQGVERAKSGLSVYEFYLKYPDEYHKVGHFLNILDNNNIQGAGFNSSNNTAAWGADCVNLDAGSYKYYTVEEFRNLIKSMMNGSGSAEKQAAKEKMDAAKANLDKANELAETAKQAHATLDNAATALATAHGDVKDAQSAYDDANAAVSKANDALTEAEAKLETAQKDAKDADDAVTQAQSELDAAQKALDAIDGDVSKLTEQVNADKSELAKAQAAKDAADEALANAKDAVAKAQSDYDEKSAAAKTAKDAYDKALAAKENADKDYATAKDAADALHKVHDEYAKAQDAAKAAQSKADELAKKAQELKDAQGNLDASASLLADQAKALSEAADLLKTLPSADDVLAGPSKLDGFIEKLGKMADDAGGDAESDIDGYVALLKDAQKNAKAYADAMAALPGLDKTLDAANKAKADAAKALTDAKKSALDKAIYDNAAKLTKGEYVLDRERNASPAKHAAYRQASYANGTTATPKHARERVAKMGDDTDMSAIAGLSIAGMLAAAFGLTSRRKHDEA